MDTWNGISLDYWSQEQTLSPKDQYRDTIRWYTGYDPIGVHWSDMIQGIPLELRFSNFKSRLERAIAKHA